MSTYEWMNVNWTVGEKGEIFHLIHDDAKSSDHSNRLLPVGSTYEVLLSVDTAKSRVRPGNTECEKLFGIVPSRFTKTTQDGYTKGYVRVAAIIPGSEAYKSKIHHNDWLMSVNDLEVTWDNLDSILSAVTSPKQIRLTLQQMVVDSKKVLLTRQPTADSNLVRPLFGPTELPPQPAGGPEHSLTVMYMTLDSSEDSSTSDMLYCFPAESRENNKLVAVKGMFLTLSNVMSDISSHPARISSVLCEGELVHVAYCQNGRQLLVIAAPAAKVTAEHLLLVMNNSTRCLDYMFSSLHSALSEKDNLQRVNLFFILLSQLLLSSQSDSSLDWHYYIRSDIERSYDTTAQSPVCLLLPEEAKVNVDNTLSEFEAADFGDMSDDFYDMRRAYTIMGTCLFYKGYLAANHLPTEDMIDMALYASYYNILAASRLSPIGASIIWQEVFPTRRKQTSDEDKDPFYVEVTGRYFLLIVAYNHSVLGVLLEAGGCAARAIGNPIADTFYINQARQTLRQLETFDFSLICEARLQLSRPPLNSIGNLQPSSDRGVSAPSAIAKGILARAGNTAADLMKRAGSASSKAKSKQPSDQLNSSTSGFLASLDRTADVDAHSFNSGSSPPHTPGSDANAFMRSRNMSVASTGSADSAASANQLYNVSSRSSRAASRIIANTEQITPKRDMTADQTSHTTHSKQNSFLLTSGEDNTLFNYISFDSVIGVVLSPAVDQLLVHDSEDHRQLLSSFYSTCLSIRCLFQQSLDSKGADISAIHEHGVMFSLSPADASKKSTSYWVIGRCFLKPVRREFFVCHHESVAESMVDLAFKVNTGVLL